MGLACHNTEFPPSGKNLENLENLENGKSFFQTWKNQGISKKGQNQGKIREFENTFWKNQGKNSVHHTRFILAVMEQCMSFV